jgi:hypothetical protein
MDDERTPTEPIQPLDSPQWLTPNAPDTTQPFGDIPPIEPLPKRRSALVIGIVGMVLVIAAAVAVFVFRSAGGEAVALSYSLEEGSIKTFRMTMTMDGTMGAMGQEIPLDVTMKATATQEVLSVDDQGVATVEIRIEDLEMDAAMLGGVGDIPQPEPMRIKIHPDGRVETESGTLLGGGGPGAMAPGGNQLSAILPDEPVGPGDTWTEEIEVPAPFGDGESLSYETHNEFLQYEDVQGVEAAVIRTSAEIPLDQTIAFSALSGLLGGGVALPPELGDLSMTMSGTATSDVTSWFDAAAGEQLKLEMVNDMDVTVSFDGAPGEMEALFGDGMSMDVTMTMELEPVA